MTALHPNPFIDQWLRRVRHEHDTELVNDLSSTTPRRESLAETALKMLAFENGWTTTFFDTQRIDFKITTDTLERAVSVFLTDRGLIKSAIACTWPEDKTKGTVHTITDLDELGLLLLTPSTDLGPDDAGRILGDG